jgi:CubicO group peptidase (beta-lactamase class C family)
MSPGPQVNGHCDERFSVLLDLLESRLAAGDDLGASVAVSIEGEPVVDLWGGWADTGRHQPWVADTITNVWSTTKTMTSLCALVLVERGRLDVHAPVSTYWPEFGANGKEAIEVRHLLSHTSGVAAWEQPFGLDDLFDAEGAVARLAAQAPFWAPGTASGYHALNQGHLVGELVRRVSGRTLGTFFAEEVAGPLGADFHIGLDPTHDHRVSDVVPPDPVPAGPAGPQAPQPDFLTRMAPTLEAEVAWSTRWRRAEIGAANGHGNARSVVRIQDVVANGGIAPGPDGRPVRLLSPATIDLIFREQAYGPDLVLGEVHRFGIGYGLPSPERTPELPDGRICFWGGWGGSSVIIDTDRRLCFAYMMNRMVSGEAGDDRSESLVRALYACL